MSVPYPSSVPQSSCVIDNDETTKADAALTLVRLSCNLECKSPPDKPLNLSTRLNSDVKEENAKQSKLHAAKEGMRKTFNNIAFGTTFDVGDIESYPNQTKTSKVLTRFQINGILNVMLKWNQEDHKNQQLF